MQGAGGPPIGLVCGDWTCTIAPERGGAITSLTRGSWDVLRRADPAERHPFAQSSFVLVPYANRIAAGRFTAGGSDIVLPPNIAGEAHPLHGIGHLNAWTVEQLDETRVVLRLDHAPTPDWPFAFEARQEIDLGRTGLTHHAEVTNAGSSEFPAGIGFHPYFAPSVGTTLTTDVSSVWTIDDQQLPVAHSSILPRDWRLGADIQGATTIDHCFTDWSGSLTLARDGQHIKLTASPNLDHLHIYAPHDRDFFCLEPVSHRPNAVNGSRDGKGAMASLAPGQALDAWMRLEAWEVTG